MLKGILSAVVVLLGTSAHSETVEWGKAGWYDISVFDDRSGCVASTVFEGGTYFGMSLYRDGGDIALSLGLFNSDWRSIEAGKEYTVKVYFGDETPWTLDMTGYKLSDSNGLRFTFDAASEQSGVFVDEFSRETSMAWFFGNSELARLSLKGSRRAFDELVECTSAVLENAPKLSRSDPFSDRATPPSNDPFE